MVGRHNGVEIGPVADLKSAFPLDVLRKKVVALCVGLATEGSQRCGLVTETATAMTVKRSIA